MTQLQLENTHDFSARLFLMVRDKLQPEEAIQFITEWRSTRNASEWLPFISALVG
jgi:hypothetical protein